MSNSSALIAVAIHYSRFPEDYQPEYDEDRQAVEVLLKSGLLEPTHETEEYPLTAALLKHPPRAKYRATSGLAVYVQTLMGVPLPIKTWVIPE